MAYNKWYNRNGNLFHHPFKRRPIHTSAHLIQTVVYIHTNPVKHHLTTDFTSYQWSSWKELTANLQTPLLRNEIMDWFQGPQQFVAAHHEQACHFQQWSADQDH